jgi:VanZ family protein
MRKSPLRAVFAAVLIVALVAFVHFVQPIGVTRWALAWLNAGHALVFGLVALLALGALFGLGLRGRSAYAAALFATLALGLLSEWLQVGNPDRNPSLGDWLRDAGGAVVALGFAGLLRRDVGSPAWGALTALLAIACLAVMLAPLGALWLDYRARDAAFPVLCCQTGDWERRFLGHSHVDIEPAAPPGLVAAESFQRLRFSPARWPGLKMAEVHPDWSGYDVLAFDIYAEVPPPVELVLRIDDFDRDRLNYTDRFNLDLWLEPGLNSFRVPIEDVLAAPAGRRMDPRRMAKIFLFANGPSVPFTLYWNGFRLETAEGDAVTAGGE